MAIPCGNKKGGFRRISLTLKPNRRLLVCLGLLAARFLAAGLGRIGLLGAACSRRIALLGAVCASRSFGSGSGGSALGSLLVRITAAAYHCNGSHYDNKGKDLFHSVKGLIISYSVTSQRYIFARILQIKNFNIFKVFACFRQAGTAAACRLCQAQKTKKGIQLFSSKGLPWRTPRS